MKKLAIVLMMIALLCSFAACGGKTEAAQNADDLIAAIGEVTRDSEPAILKAEAAYNMLTDREKESLDNRMLLLEARAAFDAIPKDITLTTENIGDWFNINTYYETSKTTENSTYTTWKKCHLNVYSTAELKQTVSALSDVSYTIKIDYHDDSGSYGSHYYSDEITVTISATEGNGGAHFYESTALINTSFHPEWVVDSMEMVAVTGTILP